MLILGREVIIPVEISLGCAPDWNKCISTIQYVNEMEETLNTVHARQNLHKYAKRQKRD